MRSFDFAHQLVGFLLGHLTATNHVLEKIARALEHESGQTSGGANDILHCGGHLAARLQTDLVRLCRHLGDGIFYIGPAMTRAPLGRDQRCAGRAGSSRCSGRGG